MQIFDDIISKKEQEDIKKLLFENTTFPWFYLNDVSKADNDKQRRPGFNHVFIDEGEVRSSANNFIQPIIINTAKKIKLENYEVKQARSFLQFPLDKKFTGKGVDTPHLDYRTPHKVFLYYVCDSDGETIIYDYKSDNIDDVPYFEDIKEMKRIKPKQGRVVVFDGMHWHTAQQPSKNVRCVININIDET